MYLHILQFKGSLQVRHNFFVKYFIPTFSVDEWRGKWLLEKKWQMKTMFELKEGMKSINDHVRLAAVSAVGKVIVGMRGGEGLILVIINFSKLKKIWHFYGLWNFDFFLSLP